MTESAPITKLARGSLSQINDWKIFECLRADLLQEGGFTIESEPFVDRTGTDVTAIEDYKAYDPSRTVRNCLACPVQALYRIWTEHRPQRNGGALTLVRCNTSRRRRT